jgi:hypothetical protein
MQFCKNCMAWSLDIDSAYMSATMRQDVPRSAYQEAPRTYTSYADAPAPTFAAPPVAGWAPQPVNNLLWAPPHPSERQDHPAPAPRSARPHAERQLETEDLEETRLLPHRSRTRFWALAMPDATTEVVTGSVILGRSASAMPEWPDAKLLTISDPSRSVSKNHAVFTDRNGILTVEDLQSTNGILVTRSDGSEIDPGRHGRVELDSQDKVELGELVIRVQQFSGAGTAR